MQFRKAFRKTALFLVLFSIILLSCSTRVDNSPDEDLVQSDAEQLIEPTATIIRSTEPPPTSTVTPQPTPTYGLFGGTQIEDLLGDKTPEQVVEELLITNGGCELPCWWGIVPGKTTLSTTQRFLESFALEYSKPAPFEYFAFFPYTQTIMFPYEWKQPFQFYIYRTKDRPNVVEQIYVPYYGNMKLSDILRKYGKPMEIHYWSDGDGIEGSKSRIILDYSDEGKFFIIEVWSHLVTYTEGQQLVRTCPDTNLERNVSLWLFSDKLEPEPEDITLMLSKFYRREDVYKPLSKVSNVTIDEIYGLALSESEICFNSPLETWADFGIGPTATP